MFRKQNKSLKSIYYHNLIQHNILVYSLKRFFLFQEIMKSKITTLTNMIKLSTPKSYSNVIFITCSKFITKAKNICLSIKHRNNEGILSRANNYQVISHTHFHISHKSFHANLSLYNQ